MLRVVFTTHADLFPVFWALLLYAPQPHDTSLDVGLQYIPRIVRRCIVKDVEMRHSRQQVELDPFSQVGSLVPHSGARRDRW